MSKTPFAATILVADDDATIRRNLVRLIRAEGYLAVEAIDGDSALERIADCLPDAVLLDLKMPGRDGLDVLQTLGGRLADLPVIVITAFGGSAPAIEAMRRGAYDYLTKPFDLSDVVEVLRRALHQKTLAGRLRPDREPDSEAEPMVGRSLSMREVFKAIGRAAATVEPVLIIGESGTGKELVAAALHRHSPRGDGPFVRVNCAAMPEGLIESELFGHERGAFTGADRQKIGRFERASTGTILLDEVGELPTQAQAKLLRVLQQKEFERVGGTKVIATDARVISATHRDLAHEVAAGRFREDLYYRLNVVRIAIPPLRDRAEDLEPLVETILRKLETKYGWTALGLDSGAWELVRRQTWPGNVRQLENALARAAIAARGRAILAGHFTQDVIPATESSETETPLPFTSVGRRSGTQGGERRPDGLRRKPHQGRRTPRNQPSPALRQDPRIRPGNVANFRLRYRPLNVKECRRGKSPIS